MSCALALSSGFVVASVGVVCSTVVIVVALALHGAPPTARPAILRELAGIARHLRRR